MDRKTIGLFDPSCRRCPRLAEFREDSGRRHPGYHAAPVPAFGDPLPRWLIVGLAPGMHGANRTGRPFTGDHAGILLYETLHAIGAASSPVSEHKDDDLRLDGVRITNAVKCLPPANKPTPAEARACNGFLAAEIAAHAPRVILALGRIAHDAVLDALGLPRGSARFAHAAEHRLSTPDGAQRWLVDSYHCSRYNTQTRRLTPPMFRAVLGRAQALAA
ncbi:MAG: uracil-DNA glycosylase [Gammaproteobacteria bacterium]|nr:uracil-DNA glycosylase [Gammaproteobacteria bacterium]